MGARRVRPAREDFYDDAVGVPYTSTTSDGPLLETLVYRLAIAPGCRRDRCRRGKSPEIRFSWAGVLASTERLRREGGARAEESRDYDVCWLTPGAQ
jgi:hypothetical protein